MRGVPSVRAFVADEWRTYRELRLRALSESPDAFGSTLAREQPWPDEEWSARLARGTESDTDLPLVADLEGTAVGLAWVRIEEAAPATANLYQMWVAPEARGLGAGRMLLDAAIEWARSAGARAVALGVTCGDTPATRMYARAGFAPVGAPEPLRPGSPLLEQRMVLDLRADVAPPPLRASLRAGKGVRLEDVEE